MTKTLWIRYFIIRRDAEVLTSDVCRSRLRKLIDCWKFSEYGTAGRVVSDLLQNGVFGDTLKLQI